MVGNLQGTENFFGVGSVGCPTSPFRFPLCGKSIPPPLPRIVHLPKRVLLNKYLSLPVGELRTRSCFANRKVLFYSASSQREPTMSYPALRYQRRQPSNRLLPEQGKKQRPRSTTIREPRGVVFAFAAMIVPVVSLLHDNSLPLPRIFGHGGMRLRSHVHDINSLQFRLRSAKQMFVE